MRWRNLAAALVLACPLALAAVTTAGAQGERAPECVKAAIAAPGGGAAWVRFCGESGGSESPLRPRATRLKMDATRSLDPASCPRANPCTVFWPAAWPS